MGNKNWTVVSLAYHILEHYEELQNFKVFKASHRHYVSNPYNNPAKQINVNISMAHSTYVLYLEYTIVLHF